MPGNNKPPAKGTKTVTGFKGTVDIKRALSLRVNNNLSYQEIANILNIKRPTLYKALRPFADLVKNPETIDAYVSQRPALLNAVEMELVLNLVDKEKLKKATLGNIAYAHDKISTARRLEEGKSTANIAHLNADLKDLDREIADLDRVLGMEVED